MLPAQKIMNVIVLKIIAVEELIRTQIKLLKQLQLLLFILAPYTTTVNTNPITASREENHQAKPTGPNKLLMVLLRITGPDMNPDAHLESSLALLVHPLLFLLTSEH